MTDGEERVVARRALDDPEARERLAVLQARVGTGCLVVPVVVTAGSQPASGDDLDAFEEDTLAWALRFGFDLSTPVSRSPRGASVRSRKYQDHEEGWPSGSTIVTVLLDDGAVTTVRACDVRVPEWFLPEPRHVEGRRGK